MLLYVVLLTKEKNKEGRILKTCIANSQILKKPNKNTATSELYKTNIIFVHMYYQNNNGGSESPRRESVIIKVRHRI